MHRFLRLAHDQVFEAWLETAFAKEIDETFPRVTDWRARMATHMRGAVSDAEDVTCALMNLHLTSHYFTKLAPLMPKRYQALIDSFAGTTTTRRRRRRTRLPRAAPSNSVCKFLCLLSPSARLRAWRAIRRRARAASFLAAYAGGNDRRNRAPEQ